VIEHLHNENVASITIQDVPDEAIHELTARATTSGHSLQSFLRDKLIKLSTRPDNRSILAQIAEQKRHLGSALSSEKILNHRNAARS
jgi:plasmid stability protein